MPDRPSAVDVENAFNRIEAAAAEGHLTAGAVENLRAWLFEPPYEEYHAEILRHVADQAWQALDDAFWTKIPFGTGGRRGRMYPIGSNAINDRTMGESAQGLADYVRATLGPEAALSCAIAYDTRHRSRHFAELCAEIMVAAGFKVYFLDGHRSTPELSVAVRHCRCSCGIMITASHNPPSDNALKVYWSTGGQVLPPHDRGIVECVGRVCEIRRTPFAEALSAGQVVYCQQDVDAAYHSAVVALATPGPRELSILYTPLHGVGATAICPVLSAAGFNQVEVYGPHATPDGDFPNVPGHVSNPENPATFDAPIAHAKQIGADLVLSTDPDADRLGCAAPVAPGGAWTTFTGNQIGALLTYYALETRRRAGTLTSRHYVAKTLVTTEMIRRIADGYGVTTHGELLVGFKYIGGLIDEQGPEHFVLGIEESHGYLAGTYARDKDAAIAALMLSELAAALKAEGETLAQKLDALYWQYGCHVEALENHTMPGSEGMSRMQALMSRLRTDPPKALGGIAVARSRDYERQVIRLPAGDEQPLAGPRGDMVIFDLKEEGNYVAVRPSGTEPKVKFYLFAYEPPEQIASLDRTKRELAARLDAIRRDLTGLVQSV